ncbi:MacS family sensor histidine kinase [Pseudonocardia xinjiangensis]|uniref:MacS family sensor histidine kinase n=1 Tax=Pseudonocardia xinjiangensis TaxID=75289 RepID=UPI003D8FE4F3
MTTPTAADTEQPLAPLWRGLLVYRVLALMSTSAGVLYSLDSYARPGAAVAVLVVMAVWTVLSSFGYFGALPGLRDRCGPIAVADIGVTVAVMATTPFVQTPAQFLGDAPVMGSIWTPGAVLACALVYGVRGGLAGAATVSLALVAFQAHWRDELHDIQLLFLVGVTIGFASTVLRRAAERLRLAVAAEAALAERERLTRAVHDGVLQVLGYVRRRGAELGGPAGELGELAGKQEFTLRTLLTTGAALVDVNGRRDLAAALRVLASEHVSVSTPAHRVELPAHVVDELVAVAAAALANVAVHVGPQAPAWVLLEDTGDGVQISVRDEGPGIPEGRLDAAQAEGRLGVARSMQGRVLDLGGTISCDTGPGRGTDWTIRLPQRKVPA